MKPPTEGAKPHKEWLLVELMSSDTFPGSGTDFLEILTP